MSGEVLVTAALAAKASENVSALLLIADESRKNHCWETVAALIATTKATMR